MKRPLSKSNTKTPSKGSAHRTTSTGITLSAVAPADQTSGASEPAESKSVKRPKVGAVRGPKNEHGCTTQQEAFAQEASRGGSLSAAYRVAYDASRMSDKAVWNEAYKLSVHPVVAKRIKALADEREQKNRMDAGKTRQFVYENLMRMAQDATQPGAVQLRAMELLGKVDSVGMFRERVETETIDNRRADEIASELEQKLAALLAPEATGKRCA